VSNNVEETEDSIGQDIVSIGASSNSSSSSIVSHICLMARASKVTPTLEPNRSSDDENGDNEEEDDDLASLVEKSEMFLHAIRKNKIDFSYFYKILAIATESNKIIEEHENTIFKMQGHARDYADEIADLKEALEEEQTTKEALEETFILELSKIKKSYDRNLAVASDFETKYEELVVTYAKLLENFKLLKNDSTVVSSEPIILTESHEQLKASNSNELTKLHLLLSISDHACATNSTSCEASILKENVELMAQLDLLTSNYGKLEEIHGKLSCSHEDLLASHDRLKLAHEAIMSKVTSSEPHVDICTTYQNAILPCASPSNSSTHNIATSFDELLSLPCCSNNEASTSYSTCVVTNHVEEIEELKAQISSLKKDLIKSHEGKSKLDNMLSVQNPPMTRVDLGLYPIIRSPRLTRERRAKDKSKIRPRLFASSAKLKGTMLDPAL
jgi:hypothetical protein